MLCPIKVNSNTIELTVHTLRLTPCLKQVCANFSKIPPGPYRDQKAPDDKICAPLKENF